MLFITVALIIEATTILSSSSSTVTCSPQRSLITAVIQSPSMECNQQNVLVVSQPSSVVSIVSDTHTTTSPVTTLSVVECLTTSSSVVTSISGQDVTTASGMNETIILLLNV